MNRSLFSILVVVPYVWACGGSMPPPTERLADAQSAERSARELGANDVPAAQLSLKLAEEQTAQAQKAVADGNNERADGLLLRAKADAELAIAEAREKGADVNGQRAVQAADAQKSTNAVQGAVK
ncbi:MAG TPA: DUF4398 domain-containing protein [Polyangiaceae bacterium]|nr:DUF4398 domain-containing protein [Polyangiaceae bacterium]